VSREKALKLRKSHRIWTQLYDLRRVGRPHDAEAHDLVQEAYLHALKFFVVFHDADGRSWPFANELITVITFMSRLARRRQRLQLALANHRYAEVVS
jgi:DNA-directed RNA polymerase specialized sigma24 family protein